MPSTARPASSTWGCCAVPTVTGCSPVGAHRQRTFRYWLLAEAEQSRSNDDLARRFIARCRVTMTILPAITTIERLCAEALAAAERRIEKRIAARLDRVAFYQLCDIRAPESRGAVTATLDEFAALGRSLLDTHGDGASLEDGGARAAGWDRLDRLLATATTLTDSLGDDPLAHVDQG